MAKLPDKCFIIADQKGEAWDLAEDIYNNLNKRTPDVFHINKIELVKFRNLEIKPRIEYNVRRSHCFYIADSNQDPQYWLSELAFVNHTLKNSSAGEIINVLPNLFFSRQDRKDEARVPVSSRVVADIIGLYADRVLTMDVHSQQIQGFYNIPFDSLPSFSTVTEYLRNNHKEILNEELTIASPDAGGGKRVEGFARRLGNPHIAIGYKTKTKDGEVEELRFPKEQVEGRDILIIDDIGDSFETIAEAYKGLKNKGAKKIYAYCTHAFFTGGYEVLGNLEKLFIGDTIKQPYLKKFKLNENLKEKLEIIPFAPLLAEAIYRISIGESLSQLFE
ncbi:MAG: ribose-phosphate diphosphokinase [Nanoarchaeota archaeon]